MPPLQLAHTCNTPTDNQGTPITIKEVPGSNGTLRAFEGDRFRPELESIANVTDTQVKGK